MSLPDDILLRALAFVDRRDVAAAASVNQRWNDVVNGEGSAPLWRALAARHPYTELIEAASGPDAILPAGGWREAFLSVERLRPLAVDQMRGELDGFVERIRQDGELFGLASAGRVAHPYPSPSQGTTATATPDARGAYSQPVFYDWGENWDRVKRLVPTPAVQDALRQSVNEASDGYYFNAWDGGKIWPFLFNGHRRYGNGEQDQLMRMFLPHERVQEMNGRVADWFQAHGEDVLGEYDPESIAEGWVAAAIESGADIGENPDLVEQEMSEITHRLYDMIYSETSGIELLREIGDASEAFLYHPDGPIRETLLCTTPNSYAFMPLNYVLARMLSPEDAQLTVYASGDYSVVVDEERNVVFVNFRYFVGESAAQTLECSRDRPQLPPAAFDYTLGGLVN